MRLISALEADHSPRPAVWWIVIHHKQGSALRADHSPRATVVDCDPPRAEYSGGYRTLTTRWRPDFDPDHLYFVTTTAANRTHILRRDVINRILVDALYHISLMNKVRLYAFVIMPNHIHVIIQCPQDFPPKDWARAFKAGTSRLIVRQYEVENNLVALDALRATVTRPEKQKYKVWEDDYLAKGILTPAFLEQKLSYIHNNPVQPHWQLAEAPEDYFWSSARYYLRDEPALIPLKDAHELLI